MKKLLPFILISSLLLSACGLGMSKSEIFNKNEVCLKYKQELDKEWSNLGLWIKEIFYSPKLNSCVYTVGENTGTTVFTVGSKEQLFEWNTKNWCNNMFDSDEYKKDFKNCLDKEQEAEKKLNNLK